MGITLSSVSIVTCAAIGVLGIVVGGASTDVEDAGGGTIRRPWMLP